MRSSPSSKGTKDIVPVDNTVCVRLLFVMIAIPLLCAGPMLRAQTTVQAPAATASQPAARDQQQVDARDLSGIWWGHLARGANFSLSANPPPMTPWARARHDAAKPGLGPRGRPLGNDPMMICDPMGFPRIMFWTNYPYEIVQLRDRVVMFFDWFYTYRTIWTDGRGLEPDPDLR